MASKLMVNPIPKKEVPIVWSIAGSDCSGGAGIQADNITFNDFGVHGCNIVTAVTAQNSSNVLAIACIDESLIQEQWQSLQDEYPPAVIKVGMLGSKEIANVITNKLSFLSTCVVCDPVLKATNGNDLIDDYKGYLALLTSVDILTPNISEFKKIFNIALSSMEDIAIKAVEIATLHQIDLVITGGENDFSTEFSSDLCVISGEVFWMHSPFINTKNTHGTGCSFSSALAATIALGYSRVDACVLAKAYINQGLLIDVNFQGSKGPFQHQGFPCDVSCLPDISSRVELINTQFPTIENKLGLYPVVDTIEWLERCLLEGIKIIQLRVKNQSAAVLEKCIEQAVMLGRQFKARVFINDYWQLAIKYNAYGVHLGQEDLITADMSAIQNAGLHLGLSTHSWYEIARAKSFKPSYIAIGPIFATTTKLMSFAPQGIEQLSQWVKLIGNKYPVVAIGGIDLHNAKQVLGTGVGSVAMVRAITEAIDYRLAIQQFEDIMQTMKEEKM